MGTTAEKLTYLNTTKGKIKDSINLTGAGITNEPFRQYAVKLKDAYVDIINNGTETLYNNFPKQTGTGETLSLTPTYQAPMIIDLKGNTSQYTTTGKNKVKIVVKIEENNGLTYTSYDDNTFKITGTINTNNQTSINLTSNYNYIPYLDKNMTLSCGYNTTGNVGAITTVAVNNNGSLIVSNILNIDSGNNKKTVNVSSSSYDISNGFNLKNAFYIPPNKNGLAVNINGYLQLEEGTSATELEEYTGGTPSPNPSYPQPVNVVSGDNTITISDGESDTTTYPINLPAGMELCKIGTYQDYIYKENDKWYLHKEIGKITFDGSETWSKQDNSSYSNTILRFRSNVDNVNDTSDVVVRTIANYFKGGNLGTRNVESITTQFSGSAINIFIDQSKLSGTDVSDFTTWLTTHNTITYFVYKTPTNTEITDSTLLSQLEAIYNAKSKYGTTNINQENNDLAFILTASALEKE